MVLQVSRWDRLKDMGGVMTAFAEHIAASSAEAQLVLAGPAVTGVADDPEGAAVRAECVEQFRSLPREMQTRIHLASLPMDDVAANALSFTVRGPDTGGLAPGEYAVRVRLSPNNQDGLPVTDTARLVVPKTMPPLGDSILWRRGPSTGPQYVITADPRFQRSDRIRVEIPTNAPGTATADTTTPPPSHRPPDVRTNRSSPFDVCATTTSGARVTSTNPRGGGGADGRPGPLSSRDSTAPPVSIASS